MFLNAGVSKQGTYRDRQILFANQTYLICIGIILSFIILYSIYDVVLFFPVIIFDVFVIITLLFSLFLNVNHQFRASKLFFLFVAHIFLFFLCLYFGIESGFHIFFFLLMTFTILTFDFKERVEKWLGPIWIALSFFFFCFCEFYFRFQEPMIFLDKDILRILYIMSVIGSFGFYLVLIFMFMNSYRRYKTKEMLRD